MPKVSVIVPNYNHAPYLQKRIDSILAQTFTDFELILMDDNSSDNSREIIEKYRRPDVKIVFNDENSGSSFKQWNKGARLASGQYIWIAESDDMAAPEFLSTLVPILDNNTNIALAYTQSNEIDSQGNLTGSLFELTEMLDSDKWTSDFVMAGNEMILKYMVHYNCIPNASAVLFRKDKMKAIGMADETYKLNGDWLFWIKLMRDSDIAFVANSLNYFRKHDATVRNTLQKVGTGMYEYARLLSYLFSHIPFSTPERRKIICLFYSRVKWSPPFIDIYSEPEAFKLVIHSYSLLATYDNIVTWLFMKHFFRRFCYLYLSMLKGRFKGNKRQQNMQNT